MMVHTSWITVFVIVATLALLIKGAMNGVSSIKRVFRNRQIKSVNGTNKLNDELIVAWIVGKINRQIRKSMPAQKNVGEGLGEICLSVKEVAALRACSEQYVRALIAKNELSASKVPYEARAGKYKYVIPLDSLPEKLRLKYKRLHKTERPEPLPKEEPDALIGEPEPEISIEQMTKEEREEITFWDGLLDEWQQYRAACDLSAEESDESFVALCAIKYPGKSISRSKLYRKDKARKEHGRLALADGRGKHGKQKQKMTDFVWKLFEDYYLDENKPSVELCRTQVTLALQQMYNDGELPEIPEVPCTASFLNRVKEIPRGVILFFRFGEKKFIDKCAPYIKRYYEDIEPNEFWVADNYTFDVAVRRGRTFCLRGSEATEGVAVRGAEDGTTMRLYLTVFMDVRTRKMMGWQVTDRPCGDATVAALRKGILNGGIPGTVWTDNGREFLFHDFGGNGFRHKKERPEDFKEPSILKELGIGFRTSLPKNGRAKGVERAFNTLKNTFCKLFEAYTGGSVAEKPGKLKEVVRQPDKLKTVEEFTKLVDTFISGWYNKQPHSGEGMYGRSPDEAFAELLVTQRKATEAQLNLMMMRWSRPLKVGKNCLTLKFYEKELQFWNEELWRTRFGEKVYVRYNPDDLKTVRIYDMDERFICEAEQLEQRSFNASKEEIAADMRRNRTAVRNLCDYKFKRDMRNIESLRLIINEAARNIDNSEEINPKYILPIFGKEDKAADTPVVSTEDIDWTAALAEWKARRSG